MKAWVIDAAKLLEHNDYLDIKKGDLTTTDKINMFLDDDDINFIIAPKGFGKTILLIYKRLLYKFNKKSGFKFIPSGSLVDAPKGGAANLNWGKLMIDFYKDRRNWEGLWRACISLSIVQTIKKSSLDAGYKIKEDYEKIEMIRNDKDGLRYRLLRRLIYEESYRTPIAYLNHILISFSQDDIRTLLKEQQFMDELISDIKTPIAIFIDNVDEYFEEHPEKNKQNYSPSVRGVFDIDLWHLSQQGLMFAIKTMCRSSSQLDIFASIRKEAYEKLSGTMVENIRGQCLDIQYSDGKLHEIFEKNIRWTDAKYLIKPEEVHTNPIISFLGFDKIENESSREEEEVFSYICRHTLKRPRDVVRIGMELVGIDKEERKIKQKVRDKINKVATQIAEDYIQLFVPHTCFNSESEVRELFKLIPHNILHLVNLENICCTFNGEYYNNKRDCKNCNKKHVFCDLYKLGLLGTVEFSTISNKYKQKFLMPGEKTFESHILPISQVKDYYLIHPILNDLIGGHPETRISKAITIGDDKDWTDLKLPDFLSIRYQIFLSHSSDDKSFVDKLAEDLQKSKIKLWYYEWIIKVGDSIVDEIDKGVQESEYLGIVISSSSLNSGWVKKELNSAIIDELKKKKVIVLPLLIDNVWDEVPGFLREKSILSIKNGNSYSSQVYFH